MEPTEQVTPTPRECPACGNRKVFFEGEESKCFTCLATLNYKTGRWSPECGVAFSAAVQLRVELAQARERLEESEHMAYDFQTELTQARASHSESVRAWTNELERLAAELSQAREDAELQQKNITFKAQEIIGLRDALERQHAATDVIWNQYHSLEAELNKSREAIRNAMNELGVPQPGYLAPVANAYNILNDALRAALTAAPAPPDRSARRWSGRKESEQ